MAKSFYFQDLVGKPFKYGARGPDQFDCWGLARECLLRQGLEPPDYPSSEHGEINAITLDLASESPLWRALDEPEPGCAVAFRMHGGMVSHVGVVVDARRFIHVLKHTSVCIELLAHPLWARRIAGFYKLSSS